MDAQFSERMRLQGYQRDTGKVASGRDHWLFFSKGASDRWEDWVRLVLAAMRQERLLPTALASPRGSHATAWVNDNRWTANCECGGAEVVEPTQPMFYCFSCFNFLNDGFPRVVDFPPDAMRRRIEQVLLLRPDVLNRNWIPTETVKDLEVENFAHCLPVGDGR